MSNVGSGAKGASASSAAVSPAASPGSAVVSSGSLVADSPPVNAGSKVVAAQPEVPIEVNLATLMEAGAHYGHQTQRWNPKMLPFIYGARNGVHIINLDATLKAWKRARDFIYSIASRGGTILMVGTKQQAREVVQGEAIRCKGFHVTERWLGGTLSNFQTVRNSIERMKKLEELLMKAADPTQKVRISKKERLSFQREIDKLNASLGGVREMRRLPDVLFVVDIGKEAIAIAEAYRLHIPVVAMVDTNTDPTNIDFPIPSNDDASRTIRLFVAAAADAWIEGRRDYEARLSKDRKEKPIAEGNGATVQSNSGQSNSAQAGTLQVSTK